MQVGFSIPAASTVWGGGHMTQLDQGQADLFEALECLYCLELQTIIISGIPISRFIIKIDV